VLARSTVLQVVGEYSRWLRRILWH
jgi:hypothetical protein